MFSQDLRMLCKGSTTELCAQSQNAQCVCPFIVHSLEAKWDREILGKMRKE